jgi:hypothetical protein
MGQESEDPFQLFPQLGDFEQECDLLFYVFPSNYVLKSMEFTSFACDDHLSHCVLALQKAVEV